MPDTESVHELTGEAGRRQDTVALEVTGVCIRRGEDVIIEDFDWRHAPGRIAWVTGPNGAGKSTLMRVLAGIDAPHAGRVRHVVGGADTSDPERVAYFSPAMGLPGETRASWFTGLAARLVGSAMPLAPDRALRAKRARSLSTGEEKRLLLGPILARARRFIFLDEPYEHLSREARGVLTEELRALAASSVVVVATNQPIPPEAVGPVITLSITEAPGVA